MMTRTQLSELKVAILKSSAKDLTSLLGCLGKQTLRKSNQPAIAVIIKSPWFTKKNEVLGLFLLKMP